MNDKNMKLVEGEDDDPEFPKTYDVLHEIKSPLNVLFYNLNYEFNDKYPAKMSEGFASDMIRIYSKKGDLVYDPMCGSGVVPRMATRLGRIGVGHDINPKAVELCIKHDPEYVWNSHNYTVQDARTFSLDEQADLILSSAPFGLNIIGDKNRYSDEPKDISHCKSYEQFFDEIELIIKNCFKNLKAGGILIMDGRDRQKDGIYHDIGVEFRNRAKKIGFEVVCRYWYLMIPYRQMTYKHKPTGYVMPMVSAMDAYVLYKPLDEKLD